MSAAASFCHQSTVKQPSNPEVEQMRTKCQGLRLLFSISKTVRDREPSHLSLRVLPED